jgi:signal transduction histidine kinase
LSGIAVQLEAVRAVWEDDPAQARGMVDQALESARGGLTGARRAIQALRASPLEELGLVAALELLGETINERSGIAVEMTVGDTVGELDPELENVVYRIADESLTNVSRHSEASLATVDLRRTGGKVRLVVTDDGNGFDPEAPVTDGHVGINGMTERAHMVDGTLELSSVPGSGTTVRLEVSPWK